MTLHPNRAAPETASARPDTSSPMAPVGAARPAPATAVLPSGGSVAATVAPEPSHIGKPCPGLADCPERPRLVRRLFAAAEREIETLEATLGGTSSTAARRLGALAAALDRLAALDRKALAAARDPVGDADAPPVAAPVDAEAWAKGLAAQLAPRRPGGGGEGQAG
ncbi:hypothetical protein [Phreatobacter sp.]|uniref:hypothetical protein n=1 Tax=Phreatobacter sp. TaxID=1966341 RepID=UPI0022C9C2C8|nr:hypothetical protein [Phreatobacter sp.]MCZ8314120.1 hypothetical protein [Phreatobacter sp.]